MRFEAAVHGITVRKIVREIRAPLHAGVGHGETVEDAALHFGLHVQPQPLLQHELQ